MALRKIAEDYNRKHIERQGIIWEQKKNKLLFSWTFFLCDFEVLVAWGVAIAARHSQNNLQPKSQRFFSLSGFVLNSTFYQSGLPAYDLDESG